MTTKTFSALMILVGFILGAAIVTGSTVITILGCVAGVGFAVLVGATVFAAPSTPPPPPPAPEAPAQAQGGSMHALLEQLYPDTPAAAEPGPVVPEPLHPAGAGTRELRLVDLDTGELVGDRVARLEERVDSLTREMVDLGAVVEHQAELTAKAFSTLRREVERIDTTFPADEEGPDAAA
ncbi:MAG: hypothetical protein AB7G23_20180 [Vicinamibacterales bacterium]